MRARGGGAVAHPGAATGEARIEDAQSRAGRRVPVVRVTVAIGGNGATVALRYHHHREPPSTTITTTTITITELKRR